MTDTLAFEWFFFSFQDPAASQPGWTPPPTFTTLLQNIAVQPQVHTNAVYAGQHIEEPSKWIVVVPWKSSAAHKEWQNIPSFRTFLAELDSQLERRDFLEATLSPDAFKVLEAPCTEMALCYGIGDGYLANAQEFLKRLGEGGLKGLRGTACGETVMVIAQEGQEEKGRAAAIVLGWDSREAHLSAKAIPGNAIIANIDLINEGAKAVNMWHVNFTKFSKDL